MSGCVLERGEIGEKTLVVIPQKLPGFLRKEFFNAGVHNATILTLHRACIHVAAPDSAPFLREEHRVLRAYLSFCSQRQKVVLIVLNIVLTVQSLVQKVLGQTTIIILPP